MEILKSKINQFPNYFMINSSRNRNFNCGVETYNYNKIHNSYSFLKTNNPKEKNEKKIQIKLKNIKTQTSFENNEMKFNNNQMNKKNKIKSCITFKNKALNDYISLYINKPKPKSLKFHLDKLYFSYYPKISNISDNQNVYKDNNIQCIPDIKKNSNKSKIEINNIIKNMKNKNKSNKSFKITKSFHHKYNINNDYKEYNKDYNEYNNAENNNKFSNPILIKDIEVTKLLNKIKNKKEIMKRNYLMTNHTGKTFNCIQFNKIFLTPDIFKDKKNIKDLFYSKLKNTKLILNKKINTNHIIINNKMLIEQNIK